jgi:hypothetical protein
VINGHFDRFLAPRKGIQLALHCTCSLAMFVGADAETNFLYHAGFEGDYDYGFEIVIVIVIVGGAETP